MRICTVEGCNRKHKGHGYCTLHLQRKVKHGDALYVPKIQLKNSPLCSILDCNEPSHSRSLCSAHYRRVLRGNLEVSAPYKKKVRTRSACKVEECKKPHYGKGFCNIHLRRYRLYGDPQKGFEPPQYVCSIEGCGKKAFEHLKCKNHANRLYRNRFTTSKRVAKQRGFCWEIEETDYYSLISNVCFYCSGELCKTGVGLDRKDNTKGYTLENSVPCCKNCNILKSDKLSSSEMVEVVKTLRTLRDQYFIWK